MRGYVIYSLGTILRPAPEGLVCYTAVFSVVTQRYEELRDDTKNGCVADYRGTGKYIDLARAKSEAAINSNL